MSLTPPVSPPEDGEVSREEILTRRSDPDFILVDVLPEASFEAGHIPGAISLPAAEIEARAATTLPDRTRDIATYCGSFT